TRWSAPAAAAAWCAPAAATRAATAAPTPAARDESPRRRPFQESSEAVDDDVGAFGAQRLGVRALLGAVDGDPEAEAGGAPGGDPCGGRLEGHGVRGRDVQLAAGGEQSVGRRPSGETLGDDDVGVDACVDQVGETRALEDGVRVGARGDDRAAYPGVAGDFEVAARALVGIQATLSEESLEQLALAVREPAYRRASRRIRRPALRQADAAAREESAHTLETRLAVQVLAVFTIRIER